MSDFIIRNGVLTKYIGKGGAVVIPEGVTIIDRWAFIGCSTLSEVILPKGLL